MTSSSSRARAARLAAMLAAAVVLAAGSGCWYIGGAIGAVVGSQGGGGSSTTRQVSSSLSAAIVSVPRTTTDVQAVRIRVFDSSGAATPVPVQLEYEPPAPPSSLAASATPTFALATLVSVTRVAEDGTETSVFAGSATATPPLVTSAGGVDYILGWAWTHDLGPVAQKGVALHLRLVGIEEVAGAAGGGASTTQATVGDNPPAFDETAGVTVVGDAGIVEVSFILSDPAANPVNVDAEFEVEGSAATTPVALAGGTLSGITTSATPERVTFFWDTLGPLQVGATQAKVRLRLVASDDAGLASDALLSNFFEVVNKAPAEAVVLPPARATGGTAAVAFELLDATGAPATVTASFAVAALAASGAAGPAGTPTAGAGGDGLDALATSVSGTAHLFVWSYASDLGSNAAARVSFTIRSTEAGALPGTASFIVGNDPPVVTITAAPAAVASGDVEVDYTLLDDTADPASIEAQYSLDGGAHFLACSSASPTIGLASVSTTAGVGAAHAFVWASALDAPAANVAAAIVRIRANDGLPGGLGAFATATFPLDNVGERPPVATLATPARSTSGTLAVAYALADAQARPASVLVEVSTDGGATFAPATPSGSANPASGLATSPGGTPQAFVWSYAAQLGAGASRVLLRLTASDGVSSTATSTGPLIVGNDPPVLAITSSYGATTQGGPVPIQLGLFDDTADVASVAVRFSTDGGASFAAATLATSVTGLATTAATDATRPASYTVLWRSDLDLPSAVSETVVLSLRPDDGLPRGLGAATTTGIVVTNLHATPPSPPVATVTTPARATSGSVSVAYALADPLAATASAAFAWSTDGGTTFHAATPASGSANPASGLSTSAAGAPHAFGWSYASDIAGAATAILRLTPSNAAGTGIAATTAGFVVGNDPPAISGLAIGGTAAQPVVSYTIADSTSDPASVAAFFVTATGQPFRPIAAQFVVAGTTGALATSPGGTPQSFAWDAAGEIGATLSSQVRIELVPGDGFSTGAAVTSSAFTAGTTPPAAATPPVATVATPARAASAPVSIAYTLFDAAGSSDAALVEFSTDGGHAFRAATPASGTNPATGLAASPAGTAHAFPWSFAGDLGFVAAAGIVVRVTPSNAGGAGAAGVSGAFTLGNDPPGMLNIEVSQDTTTPVIRFTVDDSTSDAVTVTAAYATAPGGPFTTIPAGSILGTLAGLATAPGSQGGVDYAVVWNEADQLGAGQATVYVRLTPTDALGAVGGPVTSSAVVVGVATGGGGSNQPPVVVIDEVTGAAGGGGRAAVDYTVIDAEADACDVVLQWASQGGSFPALPAGFSDPATRAAALADPAQRAALHILTAVDLPIEGVAEAASAAITPTAANEVQVSALGARGLLTPDLVGQELDVLYPTPALLVASGLAWTSMAIEPSGTILDVSNASDVSRFDLVTGTNTQIATLPNGAAGIGIALDPFDPAHAYVVIGFPAGLDRLNVATGQVDELGDGGGLVYAPSPQIAVLSRHRVLFRNAGKQLILAEVAEPPVPTSFSQVFRDNQLTGLAASPDGGSAVLGLYNAPFLSFELDTGKRTTFVDPVPAALYQGGPIAPAPGPWGGLVEATADFSGATPVYGVWAFDGFAQNLRPVAQPANDPAAIATGPGGMIAVLDASGSLSIAGGVARARTITAVSLVPPRLRVDSAFDFPPGEPLPAGARFRIHRRSPTTALASAPSGVRHRFVWDASKDLLGEPAIVRGTPYDAGGAGTSDATFAAKSFPRLAPTRSIATSIPEASVASATIAGLAVADMDLDGRPDIVYAAQTVGSKIEVLLRGAGGFAPAGTYPVLVGGSPSNSEALAVGDIDGDGYPDVLSGNSGGTPGIQVLLGSPSSPGALVAGPAFSYGLPDLKGLALADVCGSGSLDVLVHTPAPGQGFGSNTLTEMAVFPGAGNGTFGAPITLQPGLTFLTEPNGVLPFALFDLNGDGITDVGVAGASAYEVFLGTGDPAAPLRAVPAVDIPWGSSAAQVADLNGDGLVDVVLSGGRQSGIFYQSPTRALYVADANGIEVLDPGGSAVLATIFPQLAGRTITELRYAGGKLYWADATTAGQGLIQSGNADGTGSIQTIASGIGDPTSLVVDRFDGTVFWIDAALPEIDLKNLDGTGAVTPYATPGGGDSVTAPAGLALNPWFDEDYVVWSDGAGGPGAGEIDLDALQLRFAGGSFYDFNTLSSPGKLAATGSGLYFTELEANGTTRKIERERLSFGDGLETLATGVTSAAAIDVDVEASRVYWADPVAGGLFFAPLDASGTIGRAGAALSAPTAIAVRGRFGAEPDQLVDAAGNQGFLAADLDGDGRVDILFEGSPDASHVQVAFQRAPGVFTLETYAGTYGAGPGPVLADLDGTGAPHVVLDGVDVIPGTTTVELVDLAPPSSGVFRAAGGSEGALAADLPLVAPGGLSPSVVSVTASVGAVSIAVGDLNGDGLPDIAVAVQAWNAVEIFFQARPGEFLATPTILEADPGVMDGPVTIAVGDLDGDGNADIAVGSATSHTIAIFRQVAPGVFDPSPLATLSTVTNAIQQPGALLLADVDGDGLLDLVYTGVESQNGGADRVFVTRQTSPGVFGSTTVWTVSAGISSRIGGIAVADMDGDGLADVVVGIGVTFGPATSPTATSQVMIFQQRPSAPGGAPSFPLTPDVTLTSSTAVTPFSSDIAGVVVADLNGDGAPDVVIGPDRVAWIQSPTTRGSFTLLSYPAYAPIPTAPGAFAVADVDGDGRADIVVGGGLTSGGAHGVEVLLGDVDASGSLVFDAPKLLAPQDALGNYLVIGDFSMGMALVDLDGDGFPEIVTVNQTTKNVTVISTATLRP